MQKTLYDVTHMDQELTVQCMGEELLRLWPKITHADEAVQAEATAEANKMFVALPQIKCLMTLGKPLTGELRRYLKPRKS
jgi:hypothetical protein